MYQYNKSKTNLTKKENNRYIELENRIKQLEKENEMLTNMIKVSQYKQNKKKEDNINIVEYMNNLPLSAWCV